MNKDLEQTQEFDLTELNPTQNEANEIDIFSLANSTPKTEPQKPNISKELLDIVNIEAQPKTVQTINLNIFNISQGYLDATKSLFSITLPGSTSKLYIKISRTQTLNLLEQYKSNIYQKYGENVPTNLPKDTLISIRVLKPEQKISKLGNYYYSTKELR